MKKVLLYTDGACSGNPGAGGWASVLVYNQKKKELSGGESQTTNNRMELKAVIEGLRAIKEKCEVEVYSDSAYVINAFALKWVENWVKNGWMTASKNKVQNQDLWEELIKLSAKHEVSWNKVKGHADDELNNRCDELARAEVEKYLKV